MSGTSDEVTVEHLTIDDECKKNLPVETDASANTKAWLSWAQKHKKVKCVEADVPEFILPHKYLGTLIDVKVHGGRGGPDDRLYNQDEDLRDRIARGNCVLRLAHKGIFTYHFLIYALKKFTGGMGDEDHGNNKDNSVWQMYFLKSVDEADSVVCTQKANGEAAHFSARLLGERMFICAGSKNVHMLISKKDDIELYMDGRYKVARVVATAVMDMLKDLEKKKRKRLLQFLNRTHHTAVMEILQPEYQHVENLSYLQKPELRFVAWTKPYEENDSSFCAMAPHEGIDLARKFGLQTVSYTVIPVSRAEEEMNQIRRHYGYEGKVLYFLDAKDQVIGLVKKKTAWYVICRAIREKSCNAVAQADRHKNSEGGGDRIQKMRKRLKEIQTWLGLSNSFTEAWTELGIGYVRWLLNQRRTRKFTGDVRASFPILWKEYLETEEKSDNIDWGDT